MKHTFFLFFCLCCTIVYGQDKIAHLANMEDVLADTSIIRYSSPNVVVMYTSNGIYNNYFHIINTETNMRWYFHVEEIVKDVEILDDTVYYCGDEGYPEVGIFAISDVYTGNVLIKNFWVSTTRAIPKRLEVFRASGGIHVVIVGDWLTATPTNSFIADVWSEYSTSLNTWSLAALRTVGKELYDDIAVTDNYVVASANLYGTKDIVLKVLPRPTYTSFTNGYITNNNLFFSDYPTSMYVYTAPFYFYNGDYYRASGYGKYPIRITHTTGDSIALACMADKNSTQYGVTVKDIEIIAGVPIVQRNMFSSWGTGLKYFWEMRDIRYNPERDSVLLLVDREWPLASSNIRSEIIRADYSTLSPFTMTAPIIEVEKLHSMDWFVAELNNAGSTIKKFGAVGSGSHIEWPNTYPLFWSNTLLTGNCESSVNMAVDRGKASFNMDVLPGDIYFQKVLTLNIRQAVVTVDEIDIICNN